MTDDEVLAAIAFAVRELKLVVEPGGAAALAALLSAKIETQGRTTLVVVTGGNIDPAILARAIGAVCQCALTMRIAFGRGRSRAQAASCPYQIGSSSSGGAPWPM